MATLKLNGLKMQFPEKPLLVIVGPTAVGKTAIAIEIALQLNGEIISADSRYFYRQMNIGTAKPGLDERKGVPHYLIDVADPDDTWSLALFRDAAVKHIAEIHDRNKLPILVGGTGQYIKAVTEGWTIPQQEPDFRLRDAIIQWGESIGSQDLHARLAVLDAKAADNIDHRNIRRTVRALEVIFTSGKKFSEQRTRKASQYSLFTLGLILERETLYQRIDQRIEFMMQSGLVEETQLLINQGYSPDLPALSAIGYREVIGYLQGKYPLDEAVQLIKRDTRNFVRRQANWFKESDEHIHWYHSINTPIEKMVASISKQSEWQLISQTRQSEEVK
jgi:tRNA dimethylallyltransferase